VNHTIQFKKAPLQELFHGGPLVNTTKK